MASRLSVGAVVLAAGAGSRIGYRPKSLLEFDGTPLIRRHLAGLALAGVDEIVVVLGHHAERIRPVLADLPVVVVEQPDPDHSQPQSVRLGVQQLSPKTGAVVVCLADMPLLVAEDFVDLLNAFMDRPEGRRFVGPDVGGRPGNPVIFDQNVALAISRGEGPYGCGGWRQRGGTEVWSWPTDNRHYLVDIDTDADLKALSMETGGRLAWPPDLASEAEGH